MVLTLLAVLFALTVMAAIYVAYRLVTDVPIEDRTYADKPPALLRRVWFLIDFVAHYVGSWLSLEYRERTLRRLRKVELDYALSPQQWMSAKIVYGLLIGLGVFLLARWAGGRSLVFPLIGFAGGFMYLEVWLRDRVKQIEQDVLKHLPNFLDMLTMSIESGCNLTVGITIAVEKTQENPLRRAFARLLREIRSGRSKVDALRTLEERMDIAVVGSLVSALVQAEKTGASLGKVLRAQSTQRTNERFSRAEKLAMEAPVKMLGPLILCIFPCTFVVIGFPVAMTLMDAFK